MFERFKRQPVRESPSPRPVVRKKSCRRIVKRDEEGRIKEERFENCTPEQMKMMRSVGEE